MRDVIVQRLDGSQLSFALQDTAVETLKRLVHEKWQVPSLCQKLCKDASILEDTDDLRDHGQNGDGPLHVNMIVSFDQLRTSLFQGKESQQKVALGCLSELIENKQCSTSLQVQAQQLLVDSVQQDCALPSALLPVALKLLNKLARSGNTEALASICASISSSDPKVRNCAVKSLEGLPEEAHDFAILTLSSYTMHDQWQVRCAAIKGLDSFARVGNKAAISVASSLLEDVDDSVRMHAKIVHDRLAQLGSNRGSIAACNNIYRRGF